MKARALKIIACCVSLIFVFTNAVGATQHASQAGSQTELPDLQERLARVEETDKRILEQLALIRQEIANLKMDIRQQNSNMDGRFEELKEDMRQQNSSMDRRFEELKEDMRLQNSNMDRRFEELKEDMKLQNSSMDGRFEELKEDMKLQNSSINNWLIALFSGILALVLGILGMAGIFVTYALGYWGPNKLANKTEVHGFAEQQRREAEQDAVVSGQ